MNISHRLKITQKLALNKNCKEIDRKWFGLISFFRIKQSKSHFDYHRFFIHFLLICHEQKKNKVDAIKSQIKTKREVN